MRTAAPGPSARAYPRSSSSSRRWPTLLFLGVALVPSFDGEKAMAHLRTQVAFGPRVPGTKGHAATRAWLVESLRALAPKVEERRFRGRNALTDSRFEGVNIAASFRPELRERVFFGAHWDTRAKADLDPDPRKRNDPVPGANDGASGVAVLLALAEILRENPPPVGVDLLFFDGEDQGTMGSPDGYCLGARSFAAGASITGFAPRYGVVIDLVGHASLRIVRETNSMRCCGPLVDAIMRIGEMIDPEVFHTSTVSYLYDDHVPFIEAGIPAVVVTGHGFPGWHTTGDLPEECSARSLAAVGGLLTELVYGGHEIP